MAIRSRGKYLNFRRVIGFRVSALIISLTGLLVSCGYQVESNILPRNFSDPDAPAVMSISPTDGSKIDGTLKEIVITYSEEVNGAVTLTITGITDLVGNTLADTSFSYTGWWNTNWPL